MRNPRGHIDWHDRAHAHQDPLTHHMSLRSFVLFRRLPPRPPGQAAEHAPHREFYSRKAKTAEKRVDMANSLPMLPFATPQRTWTRDRPTGAPAAGRDIYRTGGGTLPAWPGARQHDGGALNACGLELSALCWISKGTNIYHLFCECVCVLRRHLCCRDGSFLSELHPGYQQWTEHSCRPNIMVLERRKLDTVS